MELQNTLPCAAWDTPEAADPDILRAKAGDPAAFERIMKANQALVYRTSLRLLGNADDALDACQDTFLRLFRHLDKVDARRPIRPWLYRITVNVCRDLAKRRRAFGAPPMLPALPTADGRAHLHAREQTRIAETGLRTLSEHERMALVLRDIEGLSTREVAEILGSTQVTVRTQVCRARAKLRKYRDEFTGEIA